MALARQKAWPRPWRREDWNARPLLAGALFYLVVTVLAYFIPSHVLIKPGAAVVAFYGVMYGPLAGFGAGFLGALVMDLFFGSVWLHWNIAVGLIGLLSGLVWMYSDIDQSGALRWRQAASVAAVTALASALAMLAAGTVDLLLGAPANTAFSEWAVPAAVAHAVFAAVGTPLLLWAAKRPRSSSGWPLKWPGSASRAER